MDVLVRDVRQVPGRTRAVYRRSLWKVRPGLWVAGWVLFGQGLSFCVVMGVVLFMARSDSLIPDVVIDAEHAVVAGVIDEVRVNHRGRSDQVTWRVLFSYEVDGVSYAGYAFGKQRLWEPGDEVAVSYARSRPGLSRIEGTRAGIMPAWVLWFCGGFLVAGLVLLFFAWRAMGRLRSVLAEGRAVPCVVTSVRLHRGTKINNKSPWVIRFSYRAEGQNFMGKAQLFQEQRDDPAPCAVGDELVALYHPHHPQRHALVYASDLRR